MFYEPSKKSHVLPHDPFKGIVASSPIGWITSTSARGSLISYLSAVVGSS